MTPEGLAYPMLKVIESLPDSQRHRYNFLITPGITSGYPPEYAQRVLQALNEEWEWLRGKGYIGPRLGNSNPDFIDITRDGRRFLETYETEQTQPPSRESPGESATGKKSGTPSPQTTESDEGLGKMSPWVRAAIAARCAARVLPLFLPARSRSQEGARADIKAVGLCWKLAALAANVEPQKDPLVSKVVQAAVAALQAIANEHNPASDAIGVAIMAASISQKPLPAALQGLLTGYKRGFARLAESEDPEWVAIRNAAMESLREDLAIAGRLPGGPNKASQFQIDQLTQRLLWGAALVGSVQGLKRMLAPWHMRLVELDMPDEYTAYVDLVTGRRRIDFEELRREVSEWASQSNTVGSSKIEHVKLAADVKEPPTSAGRPTLRMLADVPIEDEAADLLGFKAYAHALAGLIDDPETKTPLTLAINAPWGAGKTSLGRMIKRLLERKPAAGGNSPHVTCWFQAWKHDDAPNLAASLAAEITKTANRSRALWRRIFQPLPWTLRPAGSRQTERAFVYIVIFLVALVVSEWIFSKVGFALLGAIGLPPAALSALRSAAGIANGIFVAACLLVFHYLAPVSTVANSVAEFVKDPERAAQTASMNEVSGQLGQLIRQATPKGSKFAVFIDDLERCRPPRSVDVLEVVNQLLNHERMVVVVMGDMSAIAACAAIKYRDYLAKHDKPSPSPGDFRGGGNYGREYLQKIIQLQFDLPMYSPPAIRGLMEQWAKQARPKFETTQPWYSGLRRRVGTAARRVWTGARRLERDRRVINEEIEAKIASGTKNFAAVEEAVSGTLKGSVSPELLEDLIREGIQRRLGDDSEIMREAQAEAVGYVEPFPRHAKRLLNRLRLLLFVAHARRMFGGDPALTPRHLGKWAVLCERWPELAQALSISPDRMSQLEGRVGSEESGRDEYRSVVEKLAPAYVNDSALQGFCRSQVELAPVIEQIVRFEPAPATRLPQQQP